MKTYFYITISLAAFVLFGCNKKNQTPPPANNTENTQQEYCGPYGKTSSWKSIGGDTLFAQKLTLTYFYTEKTQPCSIFYYSQNYALWNDYDYTLSLSGCSIVNDTLIIKDIDSNKKAIFKREE